MSNQTSKKRRLPTNGDAVTGSDSDSEDEFTGGLLDGTFSQSEDEDSSDDNEEDKESEDEGEEEELDSDEVPSSDEEEQEKVESAANGGDKKEPKIVLDSTGNPRYMYPEIDPVYDSDDTDVDETNTIGNIPLEFYDEYPHIGYDINGKRIMRPAKGAALDALLDSIEVPKAWTGMTDRNTGGDLMLTQEELEMVRKIQMGEVPADGYDPYAVSFPSHDITEVHTNVSVIANGRVLYFQNRSNATERSTRT